MVRNSLLDAQRRKSCAERSNLAGQAPFFHQVAQIEMIIKSALALYRGQMHLDERRKHNGIEDSRQSITRNGYDLAK
jgi:hypothetical protein